MILEVEEIYRKKSVKELIDTQKLFYGPDYYRMLNGVKCMLRVNMALCKVPVFELYKNLMQQAEPDFKLDIIFITCAAWEIMHENCN